MISISSKYPETIFRKDFNGYATYSIGLSNKKQDGSYENGYMKCKFKKDVEVEDKTKMIIKDGFVTFYKTKNNDTVPVLFITEFEEYKGKIEINKKAEKDPYEQIGEEIELTDAELPF